MTGTDFEQNNLEEFVRFRDVQRTKAGKTFSDHHIFPVDRKPGHTV